MDYDAACLMTGAASLLLNLIGFLALSAIALCATRGTGDGGHRHRILGVGPARMALAYRGRDASKPVRSGDTA